MFKFKKILITSFFLTSILLLQGFTDINIFKNGENLDIGKDEIVKNIVCINGNVTLNGTVEENILLLNGNLSLGRDAIIKGETVVIGGTVNKSRGTQIAGGITSMSSDQVMKISNSWKYYEPKAPKIFKFIGPVFSLSFIILILLAVMLFPKTIGGISFVAESTPWKTLGFGIITSLLILPITFLLLISLLGITLVPLFFVALIIIVLLGTVAIYQLIGKKIAGLFRIKGIPMLWETILGIITISIIKLFPIIGGFASIVISTFALGAGVIYLFSLRKLSKVAK